MDFEHIYNWTAKRAGGRITVEGFNALGAARKVTNVDSIAIAAPGRRIIATDKNGEQYVLAIDTYA